MQEPGNAVETIENNGKLPEGDEKRFTGYGVMGVRLMNAQAELLDSRERCI